MLSRALLIAAFVVGVTLTAAATFKTSKFIRPSVGDYEKQFTTFKLKYNKHYASKVEERKRFHTFMENMQVAAKLNKLNPNATFGISPFADLTAAEFKTYHNGNKHYANAVAKHKPNPSVITKEMIKAAGQSIDWRTKGAVTAVKNQGQCGSCWAFSTTGGIEGQWKLAGHALVSLSEQLLVSCDTIDSGCNGGLMDDAMDWIVKDNGGHLVSEASYPYVSGDGTAPRCDRKNNKDVASITGHHDLPHNEADMAAWVYSHGPLSIAVDATSWQTYSGGIMTNCISQQLDHGVLIVGFDTNNKPPYWIIKNSWSATWGEKGYIRVEYGKDECLITSYPTTSII